MNDPLANLYLTTTTACIKCGARDRYTSGSCRPCNIVKSRNWYRKNIDKARATANQKSTAYRRRVRGLPFPTRPEPSTCECCGQSPINTLHLDHCHKTEEFRGWLCSECNLGIGKLGDDLAGIQRALSYLEKVSPNAAL